MTQTAAVKELFDLGAQYGIRVWEVSGGHFKVQDGQGQIVNYWPNSKKRTMHIQDTKWSREQCEPMDALRLAALGSEGMKRQAPIPLKRTSAPKTPKQQERERELRRPAGERISKNEYAFRDTDYDQKVAALPPSDGSAPWR
jgi:hypothetical protein